MTAHLAPGRPAARRTRGRAASVVLALAAGLAGCVDVTPLPEVTRAPRPLPAEVARRFAFERLGAPVLAPLDDPDAQEVADVSSASLLVRLDDDPTATVVQFQWWRARAPGRRPVVVVTPILGGGEFLARTCVLAFVEAGMHVALVERGPRVLAAHWKVEQVELFLRRAIAGRRAVVDWALARDDVDPQRVAAFGISMGGIVTSILIAAEPRLAAGVVALAGGDVAGVIRASTEGRLVRWREARALEGGVSEAVVEGRLRASLVSDPARLAPAVDPRHVLFVTTRFDAVVPLEKQELLWRALGRPLRYDLPTGHYTGIFYLPYVLGEAVAWLGERFDALPPPTAAAGPPGDPR